MPVRQTVTTRRETKAQLAVRLEELAQQLLEERELRTKISAERWNLRGLLTHLADTVAVSHGSVIDYVLLGYEVERAVLRLKEQLNSLRFRERQAKVLAEKSAGKVVPS